MAAILKNYNRESEFDSQEPRVSLVATNAKKWYEQYDDEFRYADEIEPHVGKIMHEVEQGPRHTHTGSQAVEEYHSLHEKNVDSRKQYRFVMQDEFKVQREGRILHMNKFLSMLREAGLNCWYTQKGGMPKTLGLFIQHSGYPPTCTEKHKRDEPHYICFVQVPLMQEYEELFFDKFDVPLGVKRRGWRTVLLRLIETGFLSEQRAHDVFGAPATGPVSRRYLAHLQYLRNKPN